jgi:transposase
MVVPEFLALREVTSRLEFQVKQSTRLVNRLHNLLSRVFPELATLQNDLQARWVLRLLDKYPTAERIAKARLSSVTGIPNLSTAKGEQVHLAAAQSVAAERGPLIEELVRESVRALKTSLDAEKRLIKLLIEAFRELPDEKAKQVATIKGIGERTAAILVAKIVNIERFPTASHLTSYFGVFPEERSSGVDPDGNPIPSGKKRMSRQGNDLVRKHLWLSALSAITGCNPAVVALYARLRQRGRRGDVALGHCMKKLLHQVFGVWTTGKPYDAARDCEGTCDSPKSQKMVAEKAEAEGRKTGSTPVRKTVTSTSEQLLQAMAMAPSTSRTSVARSPWNACCVTWATSIACEARVRNVVGPVPSTARSALVDAPSRFTWARTSSNVSIRPAEQPGTCSTFGALSII